MRTSTHHAEPTAPLSRPRTVLPPAGDWSVESTRSKVSITGRASRLAPTVSLEIGGVLGGLQLGADPNRSRVDVHLDLRTMTTRNPIWDDMLRAADPLRIAENPTAHFSSTAVHWTGNGFIVAGDLDVAGVATPLELQASLVQNGDASVTLHAEGTIEPCAAGIRLNLPGGRLLMPRAMKLSILVTATIVTHSNGKSTQRPASRRRFALAS